jgi:hypothetical protein
MAVDTHHEPHGYWEQTGLALLWFGVLAGPVAVATNMLAGYALTKWACASGHTFVLTGIASAMLIVALSGVWVGWSCRQRLLDANEHGGAIVDRSYFAALVAIGLSLITCLLIVLQAFPHFVLSPCE